MTISLSQALELGALDATAQHQLLQSRELHAAELVEAAILRIEAMNPRLNAVVFTAFEEAMQAAKHLCIDDAPSPFAGVPYLIKESLEYPGWPTTYGCRGMARPAPATRAYPLLQRLLDAGLIALGKTNVPEFSLLPGTESHHFGPARNPWSLDCSTAGSSGGAAAAVASGMVPLAHAADGAGSIRMPAAHCGVIGFKPSRHQHVRARGANAIEDLIVSDMLLARSTRDVSTALQLIARQPMHRSPARALRIGLIHQRPCGHPVHNDVRRAVEQTAEDLAALGHRIIPLQQWPLDGEAYMRDARWVWSAVAADALAFARTHIETITPETLEHWTLGLAQWCRTHPPDRPVEDLIRRSGLRYQSLFDTVDVLLTPVLPEPPWPLGVLDPMQPFEQLLERVFSRMTYTPLHNLAGAPSVSLPIHTSSDGLPIGSLLSARPGEDDRLLALMDQLDVSATTAPPDSLTPDA